MTCAEVNVFLSLCLSSCAEVCLPGIHGQGLNRQHIDMDLQRHVFLDSFRGSLDIRF